MHACCPVNLHLPNILGAVLLVTLQRFSKDADILKEQLAKVDQEMALGYVRYVQICMPAGHALTGDAINLQRRGARVPSDHFVHLPVGANTQHFL